MSAKTYRTLHAKHVHFRAGRRKGFHAQPIDDLLLKVQKKAPGFAERHYPKPSKDNLEPGTPCAFLSEIRQRGHGDGVRFNVSAYDYGMAVEQFSPDFTKEKPDINQGRIKDETGAEREILETYRCLALGQTLLVEYRKGGGGFGRLKALLNHVFRTHCDTKMPGVALLDVTTSDLHEAIRAGGGVDQFMVRAVQGVKPSTEAIVSQRLTEVHKSVGGSQQLDVVWSSGSGVLDEKAVLGIADEYHEDGSALDRISITLKKGGRILPLGDYREQKRIEVGVAPGGVLMVSAVETGLGEYLDELREARDDWRVIDDDGNFISPKVVSGPD